MVSFQPNLFGFNWLQQETYQFDEELWSASDEESWSAKNGKMTEDLCHCLKVCKIIITM